MTLTVRQRGDVVSTLRWMEVRLMELLAAWVPTTPEMEAKLLFGAHIWDAAQHADAFGKRTHELRLPLQHSLQPSAAYVALIDEIAAIDETNRRMAAYYDALLPDLESRFDEYLKGVDQLLDAPTVRIIDRIRFDLQRVVGDSRSLREERPELALKDDAWLDDLRSRLEALGDVVQYRPERGSASEEAS